MEGHTPFDGVFMDEAAEIAKLRAKGAVCVHLECDLFGLTLPHDVVCPSKSALPVRASRSPDLSHCEICFP